MDTTDNRKCLAINSKNDRKPAAINERLNQNFQWAKIIKNDISTELVFPPDSNEEIETPLIKLGNQNNPMHTLRSIVENDNSSSQEIN